MRQNIKMRIIFIGCTDIGYRCLEKLLKMKENVVAIYTLPPSFNISYSKKPLAASTYRDFSPLAAKYDIPLIVVDKKMTEYKDSIAGFKPDFMLVVGWYYLVPKSVRDLAPLGCAGIHAGMLPKYRGNAPLSWAIINGEKEAGISFFYFDEGVDDGDIIDQRKIEISESDTIKTLYDKAIAVTVDMVADIFPLIAKGTAKRIKQDHSQATRFPPRLPEDGVIDWSKSTREIYNWVRAQTRPYPGTFFLNGSEKIMIWSIEIPLEQDPKYLGHNAGKILEGYPGKSEKFIVSCGDGYIIVKDYEICFEEKRGLFAGYK